MSTPSARRRVPSTLICTAWDGSAPVSQECKINSGLSQHHLSIECEPVEGLVTVWIRGMGCTYYVPIARLDMTEGSSSVIFAGLLDGVMLTSTDALPGMNARLASIGSNFNESNDTPSDQQARRRCLRTNLCSGATEAPQSKQMPDHGTLAQHQITIGGGDGNAKLWGRPTGSTVYVEVIEDLSCQGTQALFTGYYDAFLLTGNFSGAVSADVISVGQSLLFAQSKASDGVPQTVANGKVIVIEDGRQAQFDWPIEMSDYSGVQVDGSLTDQNDETFTMYDAAPTALPDGWYAIISKNKQVLWSQPIEIIGSSGIEVGPGASLLEVD